MRRTVLAMFSAAAAMRAYQVVTLTAEEDHRRLMDLLHIAAIRHGADGNHPEAANYANYDEAKANPYPDLPDPLVLKNGKRVTTAEMWWKQRRPEIVEDFDREIYGRVPKVTPGVKWDVTSVGKEAGGSCRQFLVSGNYRGYSAFADHAGECDWEGSGDDGVWIYRAVSGAWTRASAASTRGSDVAAASAGERLGLRDYRAE
jgi:hypothetical protein